MPREEISDTSVMCLSFAHSGNDENKQYIGTPGKDNLLKRLADCGSLAMRPRKGVGQRDVHVLLRWDEY